MKTLTLEQMANMLSVGLPDDQWNANHEWVKEMHAIIKDGGTLGIPNTGQMFKKEGDGFVEIKL